MAEKIADSVDLPLFCVFTYQNVENSWVKISESFQTEMIKREKLADYIKNQLKQICGTVVEVRTISFEETGLRLPISNTIQNFTYIPIVEGGKAKRTPLGAIAVGSLRPLSAIDQLALVAISQRLSELYRLSELERDIQIRTQFLSIASHELKTPLTSIYGILQLQERMMRVKKDSASLPDQERHHTFLKMVIRQVERLNELIDGLLDVSRIQSGRFMVEPSETDVANILKECVDGRLSVIAQEASVKLQVDNVPQLMACVDPVRMEEVFSNMVMNAIRFSPEGGIVWLRLRPDGDSFRFTVRDQGPSVPMEDRERIFQPFERAERTGRLGGLGLGLFISREIAQLHGGNVSLIESISGKGNVFEAHFPLQGSQWSAASA